MDYVTIRNGVTVLDIRLSMIDEWPMANWDAAMSLMVKGGRLNEEAVRVLSEWFPGALWDAEQHLRSVERVYAFCYKDLRTIPKEYREDQKNKNEELRLEVRAARSKEEKLKRRYLKFMAAKANTEKE